MASSIVCLLGGCIFFPSLFSVIRKFSISLLPHDQRNVEATSATIALRCTSIFQALLAIAMGFRIIWETHQDVIFGRCMLVDVYASFGVPYMIYDIGAMYIVHREEEQLIDTLTKASVLSFLTKQWVLVAHHLAVTFVGYPLVMFFRNGKGDFFIGCFFLTELSTPALNLRSILIKLELGNTLFFRLNNTAVLVAFFVCRILLFPFMYWAYSHNKQLSFYDTVSSMRVVCHVGCAAILSMQVMWFVTFFNAVRRQRKVMDSSPPNRKGIIMQENNHASTLLSPDIDKAD